MRTFLLFLMLLCCFSGCLSKKTGPARWVARDASWAPINFGDKGIRMTAFMDALLKEMDLCTVEVDEKSLLKGLDAKYYRGALISYIPRGGLLERYVFSPPILRTGPVLVVPGNSVIKSLSDLENKIVGVNLFDNSVLVLNDCRAITILEYQNVAQALEGVAQGKMDAALVPALDAKDLIPSRYHDLKVVTEPLDDGGIRLVVLKKKGTSFLRHFESRLLKLKESGRYEALLREFELAGCTTGCKP